MYSSLSATENLNTPQATAGGEYTAVVEGYDWGLAVSKVILSLDETVTSVRWEQLWSG